MKYDYDALVYLSLAAVVLVVLAGAAVIIFVPEDVGLETRKVRFAGATFTGIMFLFIFAASLYFSGNGHGDEGKQIFEKGVTAMFTLAGTIVGYIFGTSRSVASSSSSSPTGES